MIIPLRDEKLTKLIGIVAIVKSELFSLYLSFGEFVADCLHVTQEKQDKANPQLSFVAQKIAQIHFYPKKKQISKS